MLDGPKKKKRGTAYKIYVKCIHVSPARLEKENMVLALSEPTSSGRRESAGKVQSAGGAFLCAVLKSPPRRQIFHQDCSSVLQAFNSCIYILFSDCKLRRGYTLPDDYLYAKV